MRNTADNRPRGLLRRRGAPLAVALVVLLAAGVALAQQPAGGPNEGGSTGAGSEGAGGGDSSGGDSSGGDSSGGDDTSPAATPAPTARPRPRPRPQNDDAADDGASAPRPTPPANIADPAPFLGSELTQAQIAAHLAIADFEELRPVGTTSIVFRTEMGDIDGAFRPRMRRERHGFQAVVAAYRLARVLGMDNVPVAIVRNISRRDMRRHLTSSAREGWTDLNGLTVWSSDGTVPGAMVYWIPNMQATSWDSRRGMDEWSGWVRQSGELPEDRRAVAADFGAMVSLDYLIGNWDRFSGGNVKTDPTGQRLFVRDHNAAFRFPLSPGSHRRVRRHLLRIQRFSRAFVTRLATMTDQTLRAELARDPGGQEILTDAEIAELMQRRAALLSYIGALVEQYGRDRVLALP